MSGWLFSSGQLLSLLAALAGLGGLIGLGEGFRVLGVPTRTTRRFVHLGVALFVIVTPGMFGSPVPVYVLSGLFVVVNAAARFWGWWPGIHRIRPQSWGTVALPLAVLPALAATWSIGADRIFIFQGAFLVLAVADPLAGRMGESFGRREWMSGATWLGSGVFFGATSFFVGAVLIESQKWSLARILEASVLTALVATVIEALSSRGWDNLFVVIAVVLILVVLHERPDAGLCLALGLVVGAGVWGMAFWSRALDARGAAGAGLFAASLVGLGGWRWILPGFTFFVLSSALSWLPGSKALPGQEEAGPQRTLRQVLANGGVAWGLLALSAVLPAENSGLRAVCYAGFLGALAAAAADTWATEIGVRFAGSPRSLRTLRYVPPGTSGAVSLIGSCAAAFGAASVVGAALLTGMPTGGTWLEAVGVIGAGLVGMATDGVIGATMEAEYLDPKKEGSGERPVHRASPVRGWRGLDNEAVNLLGTAAGAAAAIALTGGL